MANAFQSISSGLAELKNYYQGPIVDLINEDCPIYRAAEKVKQGWSGYQVIRPLRTRRNQGIGATSDGGLLPVIGDQTTTQASISSKFLYLRFGVTGPMIKASASDISSFVRSAAYELEMGYKDLKSDFNRQLSWNGDGTLATVNTASVASSSLVIGGREAALSPALQFVDVGSSLDILSSAGVLKYSGVTVNSISSGTAISLTATLVLSQTVTTAVGDILVRSGSYNQEVQGLLYALDGLTTTIYGVDRSTAISYQGNVSDLSAAQMNVNALQVIYNQGLRRGNIGKYNAVFSDFASLGYYQKLLTPDKRYVNSMQGDGTFGKEGKFFLDFNGTAWVPDKDCPQRVFMLPAEVLKMYVLAEMEFADETGSMYIAQTDTDSFESRIRFFVNMFNEQPAACAVLKNYISP